MRTILYTLLVGLPLSGMGQVSTPEAQHLVELKSDVIVDFEYDGHFSFVLQKGGQNTTLAVYEENRLLQSKQLSSEKTYELTIGCENEVVLFDGSTESRVFLDEKQQLSFHLLREKSADCLALNEVNNVYLIHENENSKTIGFQTAHGRDSLTVAFSDPVREDTKNPGKTANISGNDPKNIHDRTIQFGTTYPTPKGEYTEPYTRVLYEGSMEDTRNAQYKNDAMTMESKPTESLVFAVNDMIVVINGSRDRINTYTQSGELINSNTISIPRPVMWTKHQEEFVFNPGSQRLYFLSQNSTGTQFYEMNVKTGVATAIFDEKYSSKLVLVKPSSEGVAYLVKRKGKYSLKYAEI